MEINILIDEALETGPAADWTQSTVERVLTILNLPPETEMSLVITTQEEIDKEKNLKKRLITIVSVSSVALVIIAMLIALFRR